MIRILAPWLFIIAISSGGFICSLSQERTLRMTRVYLAFCAIVSSAQLACWLLWPGVYSEAYWTFEVAHNVLLCTLSAEIIWALLPHVYAVCWIGVASAIPLIITLHDKLPPQPASILVMISTSATFSSGILLMSLFLRSVNWTREHRNATFAVVAIFLGNLLSLSLSEHSGPLQTSAVQLAPLLGLILLCLAACSREVDLLEMQRSFWKFRH